MKTPAPAPGRLQSPFLGGRDPPAPAWVEETRARLLRPLPPPAPWLKSLLPTAALAPRTDGAEGGAPALAPRVELEPPWWVGTTPEPPGSLPQYSLTELLAEPGPEPLEQEDPSLPQGPSQHLRECKLALVNLTCCSLVEGPEWGSPEDPTRGLLLGLCEELARLEPEFILKVALYARQELNIRSTANFLLALAARLPPCRPHLRRYLCAAVQLPSDWIQVVKLFQSLAGAEHRLAPLPRCLRTGLADKFRQFDAYQLAKYNSRKVRGKTGSRPRRRRGGRGPRSPVGDPQPREPRTKRARLRQESDELQSEVASEQWAPEPPKKTRFSLKVLIRWLHISEPAEHVMSLLGRRYPSDLSSFSRSHLPGPWDPARAGTRMKLPQPQTWDRQLSQRGNKAAVWEELIDSGKLPFMATLRNLRNIIRAGVSERHHQWVLERLQSEESVVHSRQFPFRFLAAGKVIRDMEEQLRLKDKPLPSGVRLLQELLLHRKMWSSGWMRQTLRMALWGSVLIRPMKAERRRLKRARKLRPDPALLLRYRQALDAAVRVSARHNLPPLPGRTLIIVSAAEAMAVPYQPARRLRGPSQEAMTALEVALLLGLMCRAVAEQARLVLYGRGGWEEAPVLAGSLLENVQSLHQRAQTMAESSDRPSSLSDVLWDLVARGELVDTMLVLSPTPTAPPALRLLRDRVAPGSLFVNLSLEPCESRGGSAQTVQLAGFSEQVLRFLAARGAAQLLEHVGRMDKIHGLPPPRGAPPQHPELPLGPAASPHTYRSRWRSLRIFISSPVRDMWGERDVLTRAVLPALRARLAPWRLALHEVDLRWGVTQQEARQERQLELCLSEVARSQLFVGILGERYGYVPREYTLPDAPPYEWVKSYPQGRSITELEAAQFLSGQQDPGSAVPAFFYLREPDFLGSVPEAWRGDFAAESEAARCQGEALKQHLRQHPGASIRSYNCRWGGVAGGHPYVEGLEDFGARVLEDLWGALQRHFLQAEPVPPGGEEEDKEGQELQAAFQDSQQGRFCARAQLLGALAERVRKGRPPRRGVGGGLYVVTGQPGDGKTVFMAALARELSAHPPDQCLVVTHFAGAGPGQASARAVLGQVCARLAHLLGQPAPPPASYRGLVARLVGLLAAVAGSLRGTQRLAVLLDGADQIHGDGGHLVCDWLPPRLPPRVSLVLCVAEGAELLGSLRRRPDMLLIPLGPLDPAARAALLRAELAPYGKRLDESAFNDQMRLVLVKRGARQPLYLTLLTQDLRSFTCYEKVSERIQALPPSLPALLQHLLGCLEEEHGAEPVAVAAAALWASRDGLLERDLLSLLRTWKELDRAPVTWEAAMAVGSRAAISPPAPIYALIWSLRELAGVCGGPSQAPGSRLQLAGALLRTAVERRYLQQPDQQRAAHVLIAAHFWRLCDPDESRSFQGGESGPLVELPHHLVRAERPDLLASLLSDLRFVAAHARLSLLPALHRAYALHAGCGQPHGEVEAVRAVVQAGGALLARSPWLLAQLAANAPHGSSLDPQARALAPPGQRLLLWRNKPQDAPPADSITLALPTTPTCVALSPCGRRASVGTAAGTLHLLDAQSGEELRTLQTGGAGISACAFLGDETLALGTAAGGLEMWGLHEGSRLLAIEGHRGRVTGCVCPEGRQLLSVSLDGHLKLWDPAREQLSWDQDLSCPLNCASLHPDGGLVATGGWDGAVTLLDLHSRSLRVVLAGQAGSIRAVAFSPAGSVLASGCVGGTVRLWAWCPATLLASFSAHQGFVCQLHFLAGGRALLTAGEDAQVQLWPGHLGRDRGTLGSGSLSPALSVAPNPPGSLVAIGHHSGDVWVYGPPWGAAGRRCPAGGLPVPSLAWLGAAVLAGGSGDGTVRGWRLAAGPAQPLWELRGHGGAVLGLAVSPQLLASVSEDFSVCLWPAETLRGAPPGPPPAPLAVLRAHVGAVTCCAFSPDGQHLATGGRDKTLLCWAMGGPTPAAPQLCHSLPFCHRDWLTGCAWLGALLLSCSADGTVRLWDPATGHQLREFLPHCGPVSAVLAMGGHTVALGRDGTLAAWDAQGVELTRFPAHPGLLNQAAGFMGPDGDWLVATAGSDGRARIWSPLVLGRPRALVGHAAPVCGAAVGPAGDRALTVSGDGTVRLWAPPCLAAGGAEGPGWHRGAVSALAWAPDGQLAVTGGACGELVVWGGAKALATAQAGPRGISALGFASPRSLLVASAAGGIWLWGLRGDPHLGALSLERECPLGEVAAPITCVRQAGAPGSLLLGLANGDVLLFRAQLGTLQPLRLDSPDAGVPEPPESLDDRTQDAGVPEPPESLDDQTQDAGVPEPPESLDDRTQDAGVPKPPESLDDRTQDAGVPKPPEYLYDPFATRDTGVPESPEYLFDVGLTPDGHLLLWKGTAEPTLCQLTCGERQEPEKSWEAPIRLWERATDADASWFTCARLHDDSSLLLAGSDGTLWTQAAWSQADDAAETWSSERWQQQQVHSAKVTALHVCGDSLVTAALDGDVKIWERRTRKLLGHFRCAAPVSCLQPRPGPASELYLAAGDTLGNVYFLEWACLPPPQ
ncbi:telomerase protein component 1-like [Emydura macquarii macquarii]|uniref:telomerase protein component 1-like n=1 Tax=Emydura macquarii macquarii TaxID=1129001 RepID=UPI00352B4209